jgi:transposase
VLHVEDWAEVRRLHRAERLPIKGIARLMGISKNTVKAALAADGPPAYRRTGVGSIVDGVEPRIRELLKAYPTMPATVIAERVGWDRSIRVLSSRVAELRPVYLPVDPASRTSYQAGEIAQCDFWFPDIEVPVGFGQSRTATALPVLTMVTGYSRWASAVLVPTRCAEDLYAGWWAHIEALGVVPRVLVWDGEGAVGRWHGGRQLLTVNPAVTASAQASAGSGSAPRLRRTTGSPGFAADHSASSTSASSALAEVPGRILASRRKRLMVFLQGSVRRAQDGAGGVAAVVPHTSVNGLYPA